MVFNGMITLAIFATVILSCSAQYPRQRAPAPPRQEEPEELYEPAPPRLGHRSPVFNPAAVHYVNIGTKLDGDYKFGYDTGKGNDGQSFREETRLPDGSVQGAYGYVDASGKQRIVRYTAGKDGYKAEGDVGPDGLPKATYPRRPQQAQQAPAYNTQPAHQSAPPTYSSQAEPAYQAPAQSYAPSSRPSYQAPPAQPAYRAPPAQPAYRAPPAQPAYRAPPPQQSYSPEPSYNQRPAQQHRSRPRPAPVQPEYEDVDYSNDLSDTAVNVPIDTSLFNYNIGASKQSNS